MNNKVNAFRHGPGKCFLGRGMRRELRLIMSIITDLQPEKREERKRKRNWSHVPQKRSRKSASGKF